MLQNSSNQDPAVWTVASLTDDPGWKENSWMDEPEEGGDAIWHTVFKWHGGDVRVGMVPTVPILQWVGQSSA